MQPIPYPIRINRYLALTGVSTRRDADKLIEKGRVFINGRKALLGELIEERDRVEVRGGQGRGKIYFAYYKPAGIVSHNPLKGERDIKTVTMRKDIFPVGRLDKDSHGLMILTNDGRITGPLLDPARGHEKEYVVTVEKKITNHLIKWLSKGVDIEGYITKESRAKKLDDRVFSIILTEGKTHQIRRMCAALGFVVKDLKRIRVMGITLGALKPNEYREITGQELENLLQALDIRP